ncbi:MAG: hypothetical protein SF051_03945, partial [Elusimicrobiota bacterium]|nr:hypothetical protein [Elusimicrobiota bacterium]
MRAPLPWLLSLLLAASPAAANRAVKPGAGRGTNTGGASATAGAVGGVGLVTNLDTRLTPSVPVSLTPANGLTLQPTAGRAGVAPAPAPAPAD